MNRLLILPVLLLTLLIGNAASPADFQKGFDAWERGDYTTALREWTPLAEQGFAKSQYNLGVMYAKGQGVLQDYVRAHMWWNIATLQGDKDAREKRDTLEKILTSTQLETAQKLARECFQKKYKGCLVELHPTISMLHGGD